MGTRSSPFGYRTDMTRKDRGGRLRAHTFPQRCLTGGFATRAQQVRYTTGWFRGRQLPATDPAALCSTRRLHAEIHYFPVADDTLRTRHIPVIRILLAE